MSLLISYQRSNRRHYQNGRPSPVKVALKRIRVLLLVARGSTDGCLFQRYNATRSDYGSGRKGNFETNSTRINTLSRIDHTLRTAHGESSNGKKIQLNSGSRSTTRRSASTRVICAHSSYLQVFLEVLKRSL